MAFGQSLIFSRNSNNGELGTERIRQLAPAVFSTTHADRLSARYAPLHTSDLIPVMADYGYVPTQAAQVKGRKGNAEHKKHFVAFAKRESLINLYDNKADMRPEIVLYNSHDGTGSVQLFAGAYRFICSNGIIAGDGYNSRVYHSQRGMTGFEEMLRNTVEGMPKLLERIDTMRRIQMSRDDQFDLAERAARVRWDMAKLTAEDAFDAAPHKRGSFFTPKTMLDLVKPQRVEDEYNDAWTVFNRIQEGVIRGNAMVKCFSEKNPQGYYRKARPINSVAENIRVNRELWDVVDEALVA